MDRLNERLGIDKFNAFMKGLVPPAKKENGKERQEEIMPELVLTRDSFRPASSGMDDADIMSSIPQEFFQDDFDATRYILEVRVLKPLLAVIYFAVLEFARKARRSDPGGRAQQEGPGDGCCRFQALRRHYGKLPVIWCARY